MSDETDEVIGHINVYNRDKLVERLALKEGEVWTAGVYTEKFVLEFEGVADD